MGGLLAQWPLATRRPAANEAMVGSHDRFPPKGSDLEGNSPAISGKSR